jgi:hypothetical protein
MSVLKNKIVIKDKFENFGKFVKHRYMCKYIC